MSRCDLILFNGVVYTLVGVGEAPSDAAAIAVAGDRIIAVGDDATVLKLAGGKTRCVDLNGRLVLPGFTDTHFHFYDWVKYRRHLQLADAMTLESLVARVRDAAAETPKDRWIMGVGWNEADWPAPRMPNRADLDAAAPNHPVILWRCDMHLAAANSEALRRAGISAGAPDPPEGLIERDAAGEPTGILRELAIDLAKGVIPAPTLSETVDAMVRGIREIHALGITGLHDVRLMAGGDGDVALRAWQRLEEQRRLDLRCWVTIPGERLAEAAALGLRTGFGNSRLRIGHVKFFADGGMGARTAWMIDPYLDASSGMPLIAPDKLESDVRIADRTGLAVMIHAVGDRAAREVTGIYERLAEVRKREGYSPPAVPHRIEHAQMIRPEDIARLKGLPVAVSMQPPNMVLDMNVVDAAVGENGKWVYAFRNMMDAGIPVMFSADAPVCDPDPLIGIHAAVTRRRRDSTPAGGWHPEQRVSLMQAVRAYTRTPCEVHGLGHDLGSIAVGKRADLVVLDRDLFTMDPEEIPDTRVDMTLFDGRIVYERA